MAIEVTTIPRHIAIIMDGNGRWATARGQSRATGHREGVRALRDIVEHAIRRGIHILTVFAFSSENWQRPRQEVSLLMDLFMNSLEEQVEALHHNGVRFTFIGERSAFPSKLQDAVERAERLTVANSVLRLIVAANYGGRWDIVRACRDLAGQVARGEMTAQQIDERLFPAYLNLATLPDPDLFIRTGGEHRVSNFVLWQLAYTELYFTDALWPDFRGDQLDQALAWYAQRQRRYGRTSEQVRDSQDA